MSAAPEVAGMIRIRSHHDAYATAHRIETLLQSAGIHLFARIDFSAGAGKAGLTLRPQLLLIFGNPKGGTPLLNAQPTVGLDLPLKVLLWDDSEGGSWAAYNDPLYILQRHHLPESFLRNLAAAIPLIQKGCDE